MRELVFEVSQEEDGGYSARALGESIFTQGDDWSDLCAMVRDAVLCHFDEGQAPAYVRLHLEREQVLTLTQNHPIAA